MKQYKMIISCPEGFCYSGWQRCQVHRWGITEAGYASKNVSAAVAELINVDMLISASMSTEGQTHDLFVVSEDKKSFFVLSGESFTLDCIGNLLEDMFKIDVECRDGETVP